MNKYKAYVENEFLNRNIEFVCNEVIPIEEKPFKIGRFSKCDFYIPKLDLYINVTGKMNFESMFENYFFLANKDINFMMINGIMGKHLAADVDGDKNKIFESLNIQVSSIDKVFTKELSLDNLNIGSLMSMQIYVSDWVDKYRNNNLNLLDFHDIFMKIDPEAELYKTVTKNDSWFVGYPNT